MLSQNNILRKYLNNYNLAKEKVLPVTTLPIIHYQLSITLYATFNILNLLVLNLRMAYSRVTSNVFTF